MNTYNNKVDFVSLEIPLLIRILEFVLEDANSDLELHEIAENITSLSNDGQVLDMDSYNSIIKFKKNDINTDNMNTIDEVKWRKIAGIK